MKQSNLSVVFRNYRSTLTERSICFFGSHSLRLSCSLERAPKTTINSFFLECAFLFCVYKHGVYFLDKYSAIFPQTQRNKSHDRKKSLQGNRQSVVSCFSLFHRQFSKVPPQFFIFTVVVVVVDRWPCEDYLAVIFVVLN